MTILTLAAAVKIASENSTSELRRSIEAAIKRVSVEQGAVYYMDVGPTGAWTVYGDCYDFAEANPSLTIEI